MGHFSESVHIDAPIDHVWDLNADARRMPEWEVTTIEVRDCPERIDRVGATFTSVSRLMGRELTGTTTTTKVDKPRLLEQKIGLPGGGHATLAITLTEVGGGTDQTITIDYEMPGGLFAGVAEKLLAGSIQRSVRASNENFKALCEATIPVHA
ncbi:MAG TPA: SRPBCC family protein [Candidatus Sulfomarinibacteraceae bacterium]|nr:SRPBCC family protein [Candidatus Sulfomarinibacteraceae bacterium]